jgi:glycosyltransferase involved in cell wall biosynthesis
MDFEYWNRRGVRFARFLSRFHRGLFRRHLNASWGCVYVAKQLQAKYPCTVGGQVSRVISDIRIPDAFFQPARRVEELVGRPVRLVSVGRLEAQKDQATLIRACALLEACSLPHWELHLIGEGPLRGDLQRLAESLQVGGKIVFHGFVAWGEALFGLLDAMDVFVLSSLNEGMPRALLEAMARGLPCISTDVSGASELLPGGSLVPVGRAGLLAGRIAETVRSPDRLNALSRACFARAQDFKMDGLRSQKIAFLRDFAQSIQNHAHRHS